MHYPADQRQVDHDYDHGRIEDDDDIDPRAGQVNARCGARRRGRECGGGRGRGAGERGLGG